MKPRFTIKDLRAQYPTDDICLDKIFQLRFGHLTECPKCKKEFKYYRVKTVSKVKGHQRKCYECKICGNQIYPLAGSPLQSTRTPLIYWFYGIFLQTTTRNGVSAKEFERLTGVTYKCAFAIMHKIRILMTKNIPTFIEGGTVEVDEIYIAGSMLNLHASERGMFTLQKSKREAIVITMVQREGKVITKVIPSLKGKDMKPVLHSSIDKSATVYTDSFGAYRFYFKDYKHEQVNHKSGEYVRGGVHSNTVEGFNGQIRRTISTHIHVSKKYLQRYCDECAFRYMQRNNQADMFDTILRNLAS